MLLHNADLPMPPRKRQKKQPGNRDDDPLNRVLAAIGKDRSGMWELSPARVYLEEIKIAYLRRRAPLTSEARKQLGKYRALTAKRFELRRRFKLPYDDIVIVGLQRIKPDTVEGELRNRLTDLDDAEVIGLAKIEANERFEDRIIASLLRSKDGYRKREVRTLVVEPFLQFLEQYKVVPSRELPLNRMMRTVFDWLGIPTRLRPTDAGIRTIFRDFRRIRKASRRARREA